MRVLIAVLIALTAQVSVAAPAKPVPTAPLIVNPDARAYVLLDGTWQVIVDPLSAGDSSRVAVGVEGSGFYGDRQPQSPGDLIEYKFSDDRDKRIVEIAVQTQGARPGERVAVAIPELRRAASIVLDATGNGRVRMTAPVALWSPETPRLYDVTLTLGATTLRDRIGFRTIEARAGEILLNGRPVFLKGISMHEESVLHPGRSSGEADARASLTLVKRLGGDFVRLSHYPHDEATTRRADELGLLVWSEVPVYWSINWSNPATLANARAQLADNIDRDANRASIVIWSVANETPIGDVRLSFLRDLVGAVRTKDRSRLVSAALFGDPIKFLREYSGRIMAQVALDPATPTARRATIDG